MWWDYRTFPSDFLASSRILNSVNLSGCPTAKTSCESEVLLASICCTTSVLPQKFCWIPPPPPLNASEPSLSTRSCLEPAKCCRRENGLWWWLKEEGLFPLQKKLVASYFQLPLKMVFKSMIFAVFSPFLAFAPRMLVYYYLSHSTPNQKSSIN